MFGRLFSGLQNASMQADSCRLFGHPAHIRRVSCLSNMSACSGGKWRTNLERACRVHAARSAAQSQPRASSQAAAACGQQRRPTRHQQQSAEELRCSTAQSAAGCAGDVNGGARPQPGIITCLQPSAIKGRRNHLPHTKQKKRRDGVTTGAARSRSIARAQHRQERPPSSAARPASFCSLGIPCSYGSVFVQLQFCIRQHGRWVIPHSRIGRSSSSNSISASEEAAPAFIRSERWSSACDTSL